jgi:hypothetical protein
MGFVKKHYEKILLAAVLLGLVGALVFLPFMIANDRDRMDRISTGIIHGAVKPLPALDMAQESNVIQRLQSSYHLDLSTTNKLFNPVKWQKTVDGSWIKVNTGDVGPAAVVVTKITPLYFSLKLDSVETNVFGVRYAITVEQQAALYPSARRPHQHYASVGEKNDIFTIQSVKGPAANPSQLTLTLTDSGETVTLSKNKPYMRVDGYAANLRYDPEKKVFEDRRVGSYITIDGANYIIVAINQNEVILSAQLNQKKTTLTYKP